MIWVKQSHSKRRAPRNRLAVPMAAVKRVHCCRRSLVKQVFLPQAPIAPGGKGSYTSCLFSILFQVKAQVKFLSNSSKAGLI